MRSVLFLFLILLPQFSFAESRKERELYRELLNKLQQREISADYSINKKLQETRAPFDKFVKRLHTYNGLKSYYRKNISSLESSYPKDTFNSKTEGVMQRFSGRAELSTAIVFNLPFLPIVPIEFDYDYTTFQSFKVRLGEKEIPGIKMITSAYLQTNQQTKAQTFDESYITTLNARNLGFTHAQLISELSPNVVPAEFFEYNGLHPWARHNKYQKNDQISRPIELTNYSHPAGSWYLISMHPDFALSLENYRKQSAVMTFFLWKKGKAKKGALPDFIQQIEYLPRG